MTAPIGDEIGQARAGERPALPLGEVAVGDPQGREVWLGVGEGGIVELAELAEEDREREAVKDRVVEREEEEMLVVSEADDERAVERRAAEVEAALGELRRGLSRAGFPRCWAKDARTGPVVAVAVSEGGPVRESRSTSSAEHLSPDLGEHGLDRTLRRRALFVPGPRARGPRPEDRAPAIEAREAVHGELRFGRHAAQEQEQIRDEPAGAGLVDEREGVLEAAADPPVLIVEDQAQRLVREALGGVEALGLEGAVLLAQNRALRDPGEDDDPGADGPPCRLCNRSAMSHGLL